MSSARNVGALTTRELEEQERVVVDALFAKVDARPARRMTVSNPLPADSPLARLRPSQPGFGAWAQPVDATRIRADEYLRRVAEEKYEHGYTAEVAFVGRQDWQCLIREACLVVTFDLGGEYVELECAGGPLRVYWDDGSNTMRGFEWMGRFAEIPENSYRMARVRSRWEYQQRKARKAAESIKVVADPACPPDRTYAVTPSMVDAVLWNVRHTPSPLPSSATAYDALTSSLASAKRAFDTYDPLSARETPGYDAYDQLVPYVDPDAKLAYALFLTDPEVIALASRVGDFEFTLGNVYHLDEPKRDRTYRRIWDTDDGGHRSRCEARCRAMLEVP